MVVIYQNINIKYQNMILIVVQTISKNLEEKLIFFFEEWNS